MRILIETKGSSTLIYSVVSLIFLCFITMAVIVTMQFRNLSLEIYNTAQKSLEEYLTVQSVENMDSIKNGNNYILEIDKDEYIEYFASALNINSNLKGTTTNGRSFEIDNLQISFLDGNTMNIKVEFDLIMPVEVASMTFNTFQTTLSVKSELNSKF